MKKLSNCPDTLGGKMGTSKGEGHWESEKKTYHKVPPGAGGLLHWQKRWRDRAGKLVPSRTRHTKPEDGEM